MKCGGPEEDEEKISSLLVLSAVCLGSGRHRRDRQEGAIREKRRVLRDLVRYGRIALRYGRFWRRRPCTSVTSALTMGLSVIWSATV